METWSAFIKIAYFLRLFLALLPVPIMFTLDVLAIVAFFVTLFLCLRYRKERLPLPPGPRKLFLVGNLFDMPRKSEWEVYHKWSKDLG